VSAARRQGPVAGQVAGAGVDPWRAWIVLLAVLAAATAWHWAAREAAHLDLQFDEAQYALWSWEPAFGYFSKPPMVAWAIGAARLACGDGAFCVRLPAALALATTTALVFVLARRLAGPSAGLPAALLFALAPLNAVLASFMTTDSLLLLAWACAVYAFMRALQTDALRWWVATGAAAGLGLLSKYTMGIFAVSGLLFLLLDPRQRGRLRTRGPWMAVGVAAAFFAPNVLWNVRHQFATLGHTAQISSLDEPSLGWDRLAVFVAEQFGVFGPLAMLALVLAWWACARRAGQSDGPPARGLHRSSRDATGEGLVGTVGAALAAPSSVPAWSERDAQRLLLWCSAPFFVVIAAQALAARAHANWAAPTFVTGAIMAGAWFARGRRRWLALALALDLAIVAVALHYRPLAQVTGVALGRFDPFAPLQGWTPLGTAVARALQAAAQESPRGVEARPATGAVPPHAILVTDERALYALLGYYARPLTDDARVWNPAGTIDNHFRMTRDVRDAPQGPFLIVSERDLGAGLAQDFAGLAAQPAIEAAGRRLYAWRADRYVGRATR